MRLLALPFALIVVALLAACGGEIDQASPAQGETRLIIELWPSGQDTGTASRAELTCDPPGGDLADPVAACQALQNQREALEVLPADAVCTQIYGGPETAVITGTLDGEAIEVRLSRANGCEIDRWEQLRPVLPAYEPVPS